MYKLLYSYIIISFFCFVSVIYAEPLCKVTETENSVTTYLREDANGIVQTTTTIITWGDLFVDRLVIYEIEDLGAAGNSLMEELCQDVMKEKDPGVQIRCSPNKVISSYSTLRVNANSMYTEKVNAMNECNEFYRNLKKERKTTKYPITDCNVRMENEAVLMNVMGNDFTMRTKSTSGYHNTIHSIESYTGFSDYELSYICRQYKKDPDATNVRCNGNEFVMDVSFDALGEVSLDNIYSLLKFICNRMRSGDTVLEDFWKND